MEKKYFPFLTILFVFVFSFCSSDKDFISDKPSADIDKPPVYPGDDFTLFPKDHIPNSDLYLEGRILQNQSNNPKFVLSARKWQGIPSIGKDRSGNLYVAWIASAGCAGECDENYVTVSLSKDNGKSWSHNKLIIDVNLQDSTRLKDPNFFNDKYGNLYMHWGKHVKKRSVAAKEWVITWYSKLSLSNNGNTINCTPPRRIAEGIMLNKLFHSKFSNQVIFPIARWYEGDPVKHQPFIYTANYGANNLIDFSKASFIPVKRAIRSADEHMVVQLEDKTFFGMIRTQDGIYYSKSNDGSVWQDAKKFTALGATTISRFYLGKLNSGRLILIYNNDIYRSNMTVCLSEDDGVTWPYKMLIDDTKAVSDASNSGNATNYGVSYPDMIETNPGLLNIVYDYVRAPKGGIIFIQIKEEDIINSNYGFIKSKISSIK